MASPEGQHARPSRQTAKQDEAKGKSSPVSVLDDPEAQLSACDEVALSGEDAAGGRLAVKAPPPQTGMQRFLASAGFPHLVLFLCQLAFAVMAISSHPALEFIPPLTYCALRIGLAIPLLAVSARVQESEFRPQWRDVPWFLALGASGVAIPQATIFIGNHLAGAAYSGIFTPTVPVYVTLLSAALGIERISRAKGAGICVSVLGALFLVKIDQLDIHQANTLGLLALIANCLSFAVYLIIMQQFLARRAFPFSAFFAASVVGGVAIAVCAAPEVSQVDWAAVPAAGWAALLWAAWGTSFAAHSGICWAVGRCAAVIPSIYGCLQPLLTAGLAAAVLGQMLSGRDILAMTVILAGVALVIKAKLADDKRRHEERAQYELVAQNSSGKGCETGGDAEGGRPLHRCPSKWAVCGLDSTGHMLARDTNGSSDNLAALSALRSGKPSGLRKSTAASAAENRHSAPASSRADVGGNAGGAAGEGGSRAGVADPAHDCAEAAPDLEAGDPYAGPQNGRHQPRRQPPPAPSWRRLSWLVGGLLGREPAGGASGGGGAAVAEMQPLQGGARKVDDVAAEGLLLLPKRHVHI